MPSQVPVNLILLTAESNSGDAYLVSNYGWPPTPPHLDHNPLSPLPGPINAFVKVRLDAALIGRDVH
ncbi:Hypothetical protein NTJ_07649 [Nesidiocoris tenuis]|uniref:Uncharacterized protein n=1 Tax=Nesidiocoris tenuis TaxID=355587 RepID=A0ABN7ARK4_9HEMI|nr:Hypothetical protein NTJ_07649 [Nesidiocoris tenuis]